MKEIDPAVHVSSAALSAAALRHKIFLIGGVFVVLPSKEGGTAANAYVKLERT